MYKKIILLNFIFLNFAMATPFISPERIIVKLKEHHQLPNLKQYKTIFSVKPFFKNYYLINTFEPNLVLKELKNDQNFILIRKGIKAKKKNFLDQKSSDFFANLENSPFNDTDMKELWFFRSNEEFGISINSAYEKYKSAKRQMITVAVIDTGIDLNHEDLQSNIWINKNEIPDNEIDDDNNGIVDDVHGINTLNRDEAGNPTTVLVDNVDHGTHVAGIIGAKQNNNKGIAGIAAKVKILPIKAVPDEGDETDIDIAEALLYAAKQGAKIINCSFGKYENEGNQLIPDTLKHLEDEYGVLVVAASGNDTLDIDSNPTYPASFKNDNLLIVSSTNESGKLSGFSNFGKNTVDIAAPGSNIHSTVPNNRYDIMSGTSMATPVVSGIAAEVLSQHPDLTFLELKNILMKSVKKDERLKDKVLSGGRIDLLNALDF